MDLINEIDRILFTKILEKSCKLKVTHDFEDVFNGPLINVDAEEGFNFVQSGSAYYLAEGGKYLFKVLLIALTISYSYCTSGFALSDEPAQYSIEDLVNIADINNRIIVNLAYSTPDNFLS